MAFSGQPPTPDARSEGPGRKPLGARLTTDQLPQVGIVWLIAVDGTQLVVGVVLDPGRRQVGVEGFEARVRGDAGPVKQEWADGSHRWRLGGLSMRRQRWSACRRAHPPSLGSRRSRRCAVIG
jgi:hypothetical protein